jgi:hypothetical protein
MPLTSPPQGSAYAVIVEACDITRTLQAQQPAHDIVPPFGVPGAALRQKRVETLAHLGARRDGWCPDHGVVQEVDEELSEAGPGPGHHLLIVRCRKSEVLIRQPHRDLSGERLDDVYRLRSLKQLADNLGGMARDDVLHPREVLPPHNNVHDGDVVIIAWRDVLAQNERANDAHHPRQIRANRED